MEQHRCGGEEEGITGLWIGLENRLRQSTDRAKELS
jgi:hypothetical protein